MNILPKIMLALAGINGTEGIILSAKGIVDFLNASATNRVTVEQNEKNILVFQAVSENLNAKLEELGHQRMLISKNLSLFVDAFERLKNKPQFESKEIENLPLFDFNDIKRVGSIASHFFVGITIGTIGGAACATAAACGVKAAVMAWGTASTGKKISDLSGAAADKATMAALGGGSLSSGGGGIELGKLVLKSASFGTGILFEGIALAIAGSSVRKHADNTKMEMFENEKSIKKIIAIQYKIRYLATKIKKTTARIHNHQYEPLIAKFDELTKQKNDWNLFSKEERKLVEDIIMIVQLLHYLNNLEIYKVTKTNSNGEIEEIIVNDKEVEEALQPINR